MNIELAFLVGCWLYAWGGHNDRFKSGGTWLKRHIPGWAIRDWIAYGLYTYSITLDLVGAAMALASVIVFYSLFRIAYGWERYADKIATDYHRPAWYVWRSVQILPGVLIGLLIRFIY